jgi:hypothetical protein
MIEIWKRRRDWNDGGIWKKTCFAEKGVLWMEYGEAGGRALGGMS